MIDPGGGEAISVLGDSSVRADEGLVRSLEIKRDRL
jgi:hypothetical protein